MSRSTLAKETNLSIDQLSMPSVEEIHSDRASSPLADELLELPEEVLRSDAASAQVRSCWKETNKAYLEIQSKDSSSLEERSRDLTKLGWAVRNEISSLHAFAGETLKSGESSLTTDVRSSLSKRWQELTSVYISSKREYSSLQKRLTSEEAPLLSEASLEGTHSHEISKAIQVVDSLKAASNIQDLAPYLSSIDPALASEALHTKAQIDSFLSENGMSENYRVEACVADIDESLPEMIQDKETGDWSVASGTEPVLSLRWKVIALERSYKQEGSMVSSGEHTFETSSGWDRGEHSSVRADETELSAEATKYKNSIVSAATQYMRVQNVSEAERSPAEQKLHSAFERRQFLQGKLIWPGDDGAKVLDTWSSDKTHYRELSSEELLAAKKEYFELGKEIISSMSEISPESVERTDYYVNKYTQRSVETITERPVGYIQRNVATYITEKVGKWSLNRYPTGESVAQRVSGAHSLSRLDSRAIDAFFRISDGEVDQIRFKGKLAQFRDGVEQFQKGRQRIASRAEALASSMPKDSDGKVRISGDKHTEMNSRLLSRRSRTSEEISSAARAAHLSERYPENTFSQNEDRNREAQLWRGTRESNELSDERQTQAAKMKGYGLETIVGSYWGAHVDSLPKQLAQSIYTAFQRRTQVETFDIHGRDGSVTRQGEKIHGKVPLGHPIRTGAYRDVFDGRHSGQESYMIPVGHAGAEVAYITINRRSEQEPWQCKLYDVKDSPLFDASKYASFLSSSRDASGYSQRSVGDLLNERGEKGFLAEGFDQVAKIAQERWQNAAASSISENDHAYLML